MPWVDSLDWTALNSLRRYPLREGVSAKSDDGNFSIPDSLLVDFMLSASSDATRRFYISSITNKINSVTIEISDVDGNVLCVVDAAKTTHTQDQDYQIIPTSLYIGASGRLTIGNFTDLQYQPAGTFLFSPSATEFEPRTVIPGLRGIDRISFIDNFDNYYTVTGDVKIAARYNMDLAYSGPEENRVFLDAGDGLGLNKPCAYTNPILTINGVPPDELGNVSLLGLSCLSIENSAQHTLQLTDTCCTPCSGCDDLETLTSRLTSLENKFLELKGSYNDVNSRLFTYLATVNANCACPA